MPSRSSCRTQQTNNTQVRLHLMSLDRVSLHPGPGDAKCCISKREEVLATEGKLCSPRRALWPPPWLGSGSEGALVSQDPKRTLGSPSHNNCVAQPTQEQDHMGIITGCASCGKQATRWCIWTQGKHTCKCRLCFLQRVLHTDESGCRTGPSPPPSGHARLLCWTPERASGESRSLCFHRVSFSPCHTWFLLKQPTTSSPPGHISPMSCGLGRWSRSTWAKL